MEVFVLIKKDRYNTDSRRWEISAVVDIYAKESDAAIAVVELGKYYEYYKKVLK